VNQDDADDLRRPGRIAFGLPLVGFAAYSGTGKTTLLLQLLPLLKARGLRVAMVKHAHHSFEVDQPGKDSMRLRQAGADQMLIASSKRVALIKEYPKGQPEPRLPELLAMLAPDDIDLVLVEGFKREPIPKIELHRAELGQPYLYPQDPHIIALASDADAAPEDAAGIPHLPLQEPARIAKFILRQVVEQKGSNIEHSTPEF
jgi:molybdopterin-guanine dinucleotide biosynthesis protein B